MPGVPSSRGCEACRKLKKRVCSQAPIVEAAADLTGSGQQRYKFQYGSSRREAKAREDSFRQKRLHLAPVTGNILQTPTSALELLVRSFISAIEVRDPRYDLGLLVPFCRKLIPRLGHNNALDSSIKAITVAYSDIRRDELSVNALISYGRALKALRLCLDDPVVATTAETLTAIYLLMLFQGWIDRAGPGSASIHHAEVLVFVLNAATSQKWEGDFESEVLFAMTYTVLFASILNPKIDPDPWFPKILKIYDLRKSAIKTNPDSMKVDADSDELLVLQNFESSPSQDLRTFAKMVEALQSPVSHLMEIRELYELVKIDCEATRTTLEDTVKLVSSDTYQVDHSTILHRQLYFLIQYCQAAYSVILCFALFMSAILQASAPTDNVMAAENELYVLEIIQLAQRMNEFRPLGATFVPVGLSAVSAVSQDATQRGKALDLLVDYSTDFKGMRWMDSAEWFKSAFDDLRISLQAKTLHASEEYISAPIGDEITFAWDTRPPPNGSCFVQ